MTKGPNPQTFLILALSTCALGTAACYFQYTQLQSAEERVAKLKLENQDPKTVQSRLSDAQTKLADTKSQLKHLEANVSDAGYVPSLLLNLDAYGRANGIAVTGVRPVPKTNQDATVKNERPYDELTIAVSGRGSYASLRKFVAGLQNFPKIVAARTVTAQPGAKDPNDLGNKPRLLDVTIELKAYVFKTPPPGQQPTADHRTAMATRRSDRIEG